MLVLFVDGLPGAIGWNGHPNLYNALQLTPAILPLLPTAVLVANGALMPHPLQPMLLPGGIGGPILCSVGVTSVGACQHGGFINMAAVAANARASAILASLSSQARLSLTRHGRKSTAAST